LSASQIALGKTGATSAILPSLEQSSAFHSHFPGLIQHDKNHLSPWMP